MIFTIFTGIVFVAEIIIAFTIIFHLFKLDMKILNANDFLEEAKPKIQQIMELVTKVSGQICELAPVFMKKLKDVRNKIVLAKITSLITSILFLSINIKAIKKIRKSKVFKLAYKGLSLVQNMV